MYTLDIVHALTDCRAIVMSFVQRAPSIAWEPIPLPTKPPVVLWGWFKPAAAQHTVVLQLPPELWKSGVSPDQLTLRLLANATGVDLLVGWTLYGQSMPLNEQTMKWLDARLPECQPGGDAQLMLWSQTAEKWAPETAKPPASQDELANL
jgi:hypothetical protein